jgi:hypothetical protein
MQLKNKMKQAQYLSRNSPRPEDPNLQRIDGVLDLPAKSAGDILFLIATSGRFMLRARLF